MNSFRNFVHGFISNKKLVSLGVFLFLLLSLPISVLLLQKQQEIRQRASLLTPTPVACPASPVDTMLIMDVSSSMTSKISATDTTTKIIAAENAATAFVNNFTSNTTAKIGLEAFSGSTWTMQKAVDMPLTTDFTTLKTKIAGLKTQNTTCMECGILKANSEIATNGRANVKKVYVLLSDGLANETSTQTYGVSTAVAEKAASEAAMLAYKNYGVTIYTIGLGSDVNKTFLQGLATRTGGQYFYSPSSNDLSGIYNTISRILVKGSITGYVYNDANRNKIMDDTETKLSGWTVSIKNASGVTINSVTTNENGAYSITDLCDGTYTVSETVASGWSQTSPLNPTSYTIKITNGSSSENNNFGNVNLARCSDTLDNDNNGFIDAKDSSCHTDGNPDNPNSYDPNKDGEKGGGNTCADSKDNNANGKIDGADPVCHTDGNPANPGTYDPNLPEITVKPDLVIKGMKITYDSQAGQFVCSTGLGLQVTFKNQGNAAVTSSFTVQANSLSKTYSSGLAASASASLWFNNYINNSPNVATVDSSNLINESNETNNQLSQTLPVPTQPVPCIPTAIPTAIPPSLNFSANPTSIAYNASSSLTWSATNATSCIASGSWTGSKTLTGTQSTGNLTQTSTYTLSCTGNGGSVSKSVTITVAAAPSLTPVAPGLTFSANPASIDYNSASLLTWAATNATSCTASGAWSGTKNVSGSQSTGNLTADKTYTLICTGNGGTITKSVTVDVGVAPTNTLVPTPTLTPVPANTIFNLTLLLHGIGSSGDNANAQSSMSNKDPQHPIRNVLVELYNDSNDLVASKASSVVYASSSGDFKGTADFGTKLTSGRYTIKVKAERYLRNMYEGIQTINTGADVTMPAISMVTGDTNDDNRLNILDYNTLYGCYTSDLMPVPRSCTEKNSINSDLNDDGKVNMYDLNLFIRELSVQSGL